jgi:prepilin-type N-terminal cleavage/methylation domain-containing protein
MKARVQVQSSVSRNRRHRRARGFTLLEAIVAVVIGSVLTAMAIPVWVQQMAQMRLSSAVSTLSSAMTRTRYRAIMTSQPYTVTITSPADTYTITNQGTSVADNPVAFTPSAVAINGGGGGTYSYLFCPNGTVWNSGTTCPGSGTPATITAAFEGRQINLTISGVGNVTTTNIK